MFKVCSPYLKLLSEKGINWHYSLTPDLLEKVRKEDKLIFLHVGYISNINVRESSMELFGNAEVVNLLNENFISIGEDKDDNPESFILALDLLFLNEDFSYGPMNIFITADRKPLVCFSDCNPEHFLDVAGSILKAKKEKRELLEKLADEFSARARFAGIIPESKNKKIIDQVQISEYIQLWFKMMFESDFQLNFKPFTPNPSSLYTIVEYLKVYPNDKMLKKIGSFLEHLHNSALFDPIDGGFFRQSTDYTCSEPLFEKNLEENSQYIMLYSAAYDLYKLDSFRDTAYLTFNFVKNILKSEGGGYSSNTTLMNKIDDSVYYSFSINELSMLFPTRYQEISLALSLDTTAEVGEKQLPLRRPDTYEVISENELQILQTRRKEHRGHFVDKRTITSYNAQLSKCLAISSVLLKDDLMYKVALDTFDFLMNNNINSKGKLLRYTCCSTGCTFGYLSDYAYFVDAAIELYTAGGEKSLVRIAKKYLDFVIDNFYKPENGMFSKSEKGRDNIIMPFKRESNLDINKPSANSVMAGNLIAMYKITGERKYLEIAKRQINNIAPDLLNSGPMLSSWVHKILKMTALAE